MAIKPFLPRIAIETSFDGVLIRVPSRKNWFFIILGSFWLCGWAAGALFGLVTLCAALGMPIVENAPNHKASPVTAMPFVLIWFSFWTAGGVAVGFSLVWQLVGVEKIKATKDSLEKMRNLLGWDFWKNEYSAENIKDLRVAPVPHADFFSRNQTMPGWEPGAIAFDYGVKTIHIARGADEAEGKYILQAIFDRFPKYQSVWDARVLPPTN